VRVAIGAPVPTDKSTKSAALALDSHAAVAREVLRARASFGPKSDR
jgi:hypothetical protein